MLNRSLKTWISIGSILAILLGMFLYIANYGQQIAQSKATEAFNSVLEPLGFQPIQIGDTHFSWGKVVFRKLTAVAPTGDKTKPHHLSIESLKVYISPWGLIRQQLSAVTIKGARLVLSPEGRPLKWDNLLKNNKNANGAIKNINVIDALVETKINERAVKIPISVNASLSGADSYVDILWGKPKTPAPNGVLHVAMKSPQTEAELTSHNALIDLDGISASVPVMTGKFTIASLKEVSGEFSATIKSLALQDAARITQPLMIEGSLEGSKVKATVKAGGTVLLSASGPFALFPEPDIKVSLDGTIPNIGTYISMEGASAAPTGSLTIKGDYPNPIITLSKASFGLGNVIAEGINGTIKIVSLFPLTTAPYQHLTGHTIGIGSIALKDNDLEFSINKERGLIFHRYSSRTLGGKVESHSFIPTKDGTTFETEFKAVDLNQLLSLAQLSGVTAQGNISGSASLIYSKKNGLDLIGAEIRSISDQGRLQVVTNTKDNVAFEALEDLHFTLLDVKIRPSASSPGNLEAAVKILGSNPNVLNSYPFEFNITANGKLKDLVVNTISSLTSPKDMKEVSKKLDKHRNPKK